MSLLNESITDDDAIFGAFKKIKYKNLFYRDGLWII